MFLNVHVYMYIYTYMYTWRENNDDEPWKPEDHIIGRGGRGKGGKGEENDVPDESTLLHMINF